MNSTQTPADAGVFIDLENVSLQAYGKKILKDICMQIFRGKHWAVLGPSGSGKTSLLRALAAQMHISSGKAHVTGPHPFGTQEWLHHTALVEMRHSFKSNDGVTGFYYQQRFNAGDKTDTITVSEYLLRLREKYQIGESAMLHLNEYLQTERLKDKLLIQLSSGETRRLLITAALLKQPDLLLLDMPQTGLDDAGKMAFDRLLVSLSAKNCTVILTTTKGLMPENISQVAVLEEGRITATYDRNVFHPSSIHFEHAPEIDAMQLHRLLQNYSASPFDTIVKMHDVHIRYGDVVIFDNLNWSVSPGEKWALIGENGSGKSTLLSLINADHPQAYANNIVLFDRKRGTGESIWDIKKNTGFVSAELYQYFPQEQTCSQVIGSGYFDTIGLFRQLSINQLEEIKRWMTLIKIESFANNLFRLAPVGVQRMVLLIRAVIKRPPLLLLDEPAQGLDDEQRLQLKMLVTELCSHPEITLIYVTHQFSELPEGIGKVLRLSRNEPSRIMKINELEHMDGLITN